MDFATRRFRATAEATDRFLAKVGRGRSLYDIRNEFGFPFSVGFSVKGVLASQGVL